MTSGVQLRTGSYHPEELLTPLSPTVLLRQVTVMVVDDEEPLRLYLSRVMEDAGYHVLTARDGVAALALFEHSRYPVQLVITDVNMPRMTGLELAARLADQPHAPPVLFVSGGHGHGDLPGPLLGKPFLAPDLTGLVRRILQVRKRRPLSPTPAPSEEPLIPALSCASS